MNITRRHTAHAQRAHRARHSGPGGSKYHRRGAKGSITDREKRLTGRQEWLVELQAILVRARADPDTSQQAVFNFCAPLVSFAYILAVVVVVLRWPRAHDAVLEILEDMGSHKVAQVLALAAMLVLGMVGAMGCLRGVIWGVSYGIGGFVEMNIAPEATVEIGNNSDSLELSGMNLLFGGLL